MAVASLHPMRPQTARMFVERIGRYIRPECFLYPVMLHATRFRDGVKAERGTTRRGSTTADINKLPKLDRCSAQLHGRHGEDLQPLSIEEGRTVA